MALMLSNLYTALLDAGASEDNARKAAEEAAAYETRLTSIDAKLDRVQTHLSVLQWVAGVGLSLMLALALVNLNWTWQIMQRLPVGTP
jgi:hypothetical protein